MGSYGYKYSCFLSKNFRDTVTRIGIYISDTW